jgi:hypothetical protein
MLTVTDLVLAVVGATLALVPIAITVQGWYGVHRRVDTLAHATAGASLAAFSLALLAAPPLAHVALVTSLAIAWELVEPRLHWTLPIQPVDNTGPQDTEADIAVVGLAAAIVAMTLG